ncbi:MAG TPA: GNAT family N-acetyltransferase, partial [Acidimicrobiales bacterium]|nr:GNAT family N-acetyltransferase [Acidimicrobiales bacterium]
TGRLAAGPPAARADVLGLAVADGHRRQGVGSRLLDAFLSEAADRHCTVVRAVLDAGGGPGAALFTSRGFRALGSAGGVEVLERWLVHT